MTESGLEPNSAKKPYWYIEYIDWCPLCLSEDRIRERVYDRPRPDDYNERHIWKEVWDYCDV